MECRKTQHVTQDSHNNVLVLRNMGACMQSFETHKINGQSPNNKIKSECTKFNTELSCITRPGFVLLFEYTLGKRD